MGNQYTSEQRQIVENILNNIFDNKYSILDLKSRIGSTDYIDFIKPDELGDLNIMKGKDILNRNFIVFKSELLINDKKIKMFTTFFQRYNDNSITYHTAGHYGKLLFNTEGGCSLEQFKYLYTLLQNNTIELDYSQASEFRINHYEDEDLTSKYKVVLGWS